MRLVPTFPRFLADIWCKAPPQPLERNQFLSPGPDDCELLVQSRPGGFWKGRVEEEPEDSEKGGVGVEVESDYDLITT
jgi:hypothetical protein